MGAFVGGLATLVGVVDGANEVGIPVGETVVGTGVGNIVGKRVGLWVGGVQVPPLSGHS